jgi:indole-3-glycerol phosphate synthase
MTVLDDIVKRTRERLRDEALDVENVSDAARKVMKQRKPYAFSDALRREGVNIIAEIKAASPSAGAIVENPDVESIAREYKSGGAAAI